MNADRGALCSLKSRRPLPQELTSITLTDDNEHVLINTVPDVSFPGHVLTLPNPLTPVSSRNCNCGASTKTHFTLSAGSQDIFSVSIKSRAVWVE